MHVLFIGNSYTFVNGGLGAQLSGLDPSIQTSTIALGGYSLEMHWKNKNAVEAIQKGGWDYVILQEQSQTPIIGRTSFVEYARKFDEIIRQAGAKTILLMTWERPDSRAVGVTTANIAVAYNSLGAELGAKVAPAGLAFEASLQKKPELVLYSQDGHPTITGTYLAACVLYSVITKRTPEENEYSDPTISPEVRAYLQRIAVNTLSSDPH